MIFFFFSFVQNNCFCFLCKYSYCKQSRSKIEFSFAYVFLFPLFFLGGNAFFFFLQFTGSLLLLLLRCLEWRIRTVSIFVRTRNCGVNITIIIIIVYETNSTFVCVQDDGEQQRLDEIYIYVWRRAERWAVVILHNKTNEQNMNAFGMKWKWIGGDD